ncbi:MAG: hypothetical protein AAFQ52_17615, partial [Chloroflexota bacterium]
TDHEALYEQAKAVREAFYAVETSFIEPDLKAGWRGMLNKGSQLLPKIANVPSVIECGDYRPTDQTYDAYNELKSLVDAQVSEMHALIEGDLAVFNKAIGASDIAIVGA